MSASYLIPPTCCYGRFIRVHTLRSARWNAAQREEITCATWSSLCSLSLASFSNRSIVSSISIFSMSWIAGIRVIVGQWHISSVNGGSHLCSMRTRDDLLILLLVKDSSKFCSNAVLFLLSLFHLFFKFGKLTLIYFQLHVISCMQVGQSGRVVRTGLQSENGREYVKIILATKIN